MKSLLYAALAVVLVALAGPARGQQAWPPAEEALALAQAEVRKLDSQARLIRVELLGVEPGGGLEAAVFVFNSPKLQKQGGPNTSHRIEVRGSRVASVSQTAEPWRWSEANRLTPDLAEARLAANLGAGLAGWWQAHPQGKATMILRPKGAEDRFAASKSHWLWEIAAAGPDGARFSTHLDAASLTALTPLKGGPGEKFPAAELLALALDKARKFDPQARLIRAHYDLGDKESRFERAEFWFNCPRLKAKERYARSLGVYIRGGVVDRLRKLATEWFWDDAADLDGRPEKAFQAAWKAGLGQWWPSEGQVWLSQILNPPRRSKKGESGRAGWRWTISAGVSGQPGQTFSLDLDGRSLAVLGRR